MASVIMPAGLVKLMTQAFGRTAATRSATCTATGTVRSPKRHAARAGGLLAQQAEVERDPLVDGAPGQAADAHRGEHEVRAGERGVEIGRWPAPRAAHGPPPCRASDLTDGGRAGGTSTSCSDTSRRPARHRCRARSASYTSGTRNPPPPRITSFMRAPPPRPARRARGEGSASAPSLVTTTDLLRRRTRAALRYRETCAGRRRSTARRRAAMIARLTGTSTSVVSSTGPSARDAAGPEEGEVGAHLPQGVLGEHPDQRVVGAPDGPPSRTSSTAGRRAARRAPRGWR